MIAGIGIDIVDISHFERILKRHKKRFLKRIFTKDELKDCRGKSKIPRLAARFASKEAFLKALGTGLSSGISWHDMNVKRDTIIAKGRTGSILGKKGIKKVFLSFSHSQNSVLAVAILEK
jgi:holo-[acyl-carrier protein] synthase